MNWLATQFRVGRPGTLIPIAHGQTNRLGVHKFETSEGCFSVKLYDERPRENALAIEKAAYNSAFPMPQSLPTVDGETVAETVVAGQTVWLCVHSWVEGEPLPWTIADPNISQRVGGLVARLHRLPVDKQYLQEEPWSALGQCQWRTLAEKATVQGAVWADEFRRKLDILSQWEEFLATRHSEDSVAVPSHRDLHPPNLIRRPNGELVVVDWDSAGPANLNGDVVGSAQIWASQADERSRKSTIRAFLSGYRGAGGVYEPRGVEDLKPLLRTRIWWLAYNIRRDLGRHPGPDPDLTGTLLSRLRKPDFCELKKTASYFD